MTSVAERLPSASNQIKRTIHARTIDLATTDGQSVDTVRGNAGDEYRYW